VDYLLAGGGMPFSAPRDHGFTNDLRTMRSIEVTQD